MCALTGYLIFIFFGIAGHFHVCLVRGHGSGSDGRGCDWRPSRLFPGEGFGSQDVSTRSWANLATLQVEGMVCPEPLAGTSLPTLVGVWGLDHKSNCGLGIGPGVGKSFQVRQNQ